MDARLTQPELDALTLSARGYSTREAAQHLRKSPETIKAQLGIARLKLGARNTTHAVALVLEAGLLAA